MLWGSLWTQYPQFGDERSSIFGTTVQLVFLHCESVPREKKIHNLTSEVKDYSENETSIYKSWQLGSLRVYTRNHVCIYHIRTRVSAGSRTKPTIVMRVRSHSREIILYTLSSLFFKYTFVCEQDFKNRETGCINFYVCAPPLKATVYQTFI